MNATPRGLSRQQADELSGRVYGWLKAKGIGKEDFVYLCLPRGAIALISVLGVWKAGAAFTMVEDNYPPERIAFIREDCACKVVIDKDSWSEILRTEPLKGYEQTDMHDAAFAVYTSGTTGNPKGALHEYGNLKLIQAASLDPETGLPRLTAQDRMTLIPPLNFIAALRRYIYALYDGCHVFVVPYSIIKNPVLLRQYYQDNRITVTYSSPSMIRLIGDPGPTIRQIQIGGEPANGIFIEGKELVNKSFRKLRAKSGYIVYGYRGFQLKTLEEKKKKEQEIEKRVEELIVQSEIAGLGEMPVSVMGFSIRITNALAKNKINTFADLVEVLVKETRIRTIGAGAKEEMIEKLKEYGVDLPE